MTFQMEDSLTSIMNFEVIKFKCYYVIYIKDKLWIFQHKCGKSFSYETLKQTCIDIILTMITSLSTK